MFDPSFATTAARAYEQAAGLKSDLDAKAGLPDFADLLRTAATQVSSAGQTLETSVVQAASGQADLIDVVTAVAAAEANLETVIAVRDQVIKAYQEIMRMPI